MPNDPPMIIVIDPPIRIAIDPAAWGNDRTVSDQTGADLYEAMFPMPAKGEKIRVPKQPMLRLKMGGTTEAQCLGELRMKLAPLNVTIDEMAKGPRYA